MAETKDVGIFGNVFPFKNIRQAHGRSCIPLNYFLASVLTNKHHFSMRKGKRMIIRKHRNVLEIILAATPKPE